MIHDNSTPQSSWKIIVRIILKALVLFIIINLLYAAVNPLPLLGRLTLYNSLLPGRPRLPFGEDPHKAYNFSINSIEAMIASHELNGEKISGDEYRILVLGDSGTWGTLLKPDQTLSGLVNIASLNTPDGRPVRAYNLAYPTLSLTKDLMLLDEGLRYQPDLVLWLVTLDSFPQNKQMENPLVAGSPDRAKRLLVSAGITIPGEAQSFTRSTFWQRTIIGQRRALADLVRYQLYGFMWAATGIDQVYPSDYQPAQRDLEPDETYNGWTPPKLPVDQLVFDILAAGVDLAGQVPVIIINEPILISEGQNSDVRYNYYYPRWAYDQYRRHLTTYCTQNNLASYDFWDLVPESEFTNTAIHLSPVGEVMLAEEVINILTEQIHK